MQVRISEGEWNFYIDKLWIDLFCYWPVLLIVIVLILWMFLSFWKSNVKQLKWTSPLPLLCFKPHFPPICSGFQNPLAPPYPLSLATTFLVLLLFPLSPKLLSLLLDQSMWDYTNQILLLLLSKICTICWYLLIFFLRKINIVMIN